MAINGITAAPTQAPEPTAPTEAAAPTPKVDALAAASTNSIEKFGAAASKLSKDDLMTIGRVVEDFFKLLGQIGQKPDANSTSKLDLGVILNEVSQLFEIAKKLDTNAPAPSGSSKAATAIEQKASAENAKPANGNQALEAAGWQAANIALDVIQREAFKGIKPENHGSNVSVGGKTDLAHAHEHANVAGMKLDAEAKVQTNVGADASSMSHVGPDGVSGQAKAGARAGVAVGAKVSADTPFGRGFAGVKAAADVHAETEAHYRANLHGAEAGASASVGAMVNADAYAGFHSKDGSVKLDARATAEAGAGADAAAKVAVTTAPPSAIVQGKAAAFAGARASACAQADIGGLSAKATAGVSAGAGVEVDFQAGMGPDGKFHFQIGCAVSVGVGVKYSTDLSFDPNDFGQMLMFGLMMLGGPISGLLTMLPAMLEGKVSDGEHANGVIDQALAGNQGAPKKNTPQHQEGGSGTYMGDPSFVTSRDEPNLIDSPEDRLQRASDLGASVFTQGKHQTIAKG